MTENLGVGGRIRDGRVDTGMLVVNNARMVSAELVRRALTNAGFGLDDAHWYTQQKAGSQTKFVVSLAYTSSDGPIKEIDRKTADALRELASTAWFCHIWLNPNGVVTINFVGIQQGGPRQQVTVRNNVLGLVPTNDTSSAIADGINLEHAKTILVKFFFTNAKRIPQGINQVERSSNEVMDSRHAAAVSKADGSFVGGE